MLRQTKPKMLIPIPSRRPEQPKTERIPENPRKTGFFRDYVAFSAFFSAGIGKTLPSPLVLLYFINGLVLIPHLRVLALSFSCSQL